MNVEDRLKEITERLFALEGKPLESTKLISPVPATAKATVPVPRTTGRDGSSGLLWKLIKYTGIALIVFIIFSIIKRRMKGPKRIPKPLITPVVANKTESHTTPITSLEELLRHKEKESKKQDESSPSPIVEEI